MKESAVTNDEVDALASRRLHANAFSLNFDHLASHSKVNSFVDDMRGLHPIDSQAVFNEVCKEVCRLWKKHFPHGHNGTSAKFKKLDLIISSGAVENEVIQTQWGGVVVTAYQHPEVEKFLVIRNGGYLALEKHEEKDEFIEVLEGTGVLLSGDGAENILSVHELYPGETFHFEPGVEHCVIGTEDLLVFERSTDPKGMDQDLIFIYTPEKG